MIWCIRSWGRHRKCHVRPIKKNTDAVAVFQESFADHLLAAIPPDSHLPVRVWAEDESRFGLHTIRGQRITARGVKPIGIHQHRFENTWIYGAVEPATGAGHFMEFPKLTTAMMQRFIDDFAATYPDSLNLILVDNSRTHTTKQLLLPANVILVFQPPYSPEVNPCERVWQAIKRACRWQCFPDLTAVQTHLVTTLRNMTEDMLTSLTQYPYFMAGVYAVSSR